MFTHTHLSAAPRFPLSCSSSLAKPALAHLHGLLPAAEALSRLLGLYLGLEGGAALGVDVLEVVEALPDADGQASRDGGAEGGGFAHGGAVDGDTNQVGLGLE